MNELFRKNSDSILRGIGIKKTLASWKENNFHSTELRRKMWDTFLRK